MTASRTTARFILSLLLLALGVPGPSASAAPVSPLSNDELRALFAIDSSAATFFPSIA